MKNPIGNNYLFRREICVLKKIKEGFRKGNCGLQIVGEMKEVVKTTLVLPGVKMIWNILLAMHLHMIYKRVMCLQDPRHGKRQ